MTTKEKIEAQAHTIFHEETGLEISLSINRALNKIIKVNDKALLEIVRGACKERKLIGKERKYDGDNINSACAVYSHAFTNWGEVIRFEDGHDKALSDITTLLDKLINEI